MGNKQTAPAVVEEAPKENDEEFLDSLEKFANLADTPEPLYDVGHGKASSFVLPSGWLSNKWYPKPEQRPH